MRAKFEALIDRSVVVNASRCSYHLLQNFGLRVSFLLDSHWPNGSHSAASTVAALQSFHSHFRYTANFQKHQRRTATMHIGVRKVP